ncbi:MAG: F0F1 ATP synthase subunit delta [Campylobacterota bacterium]|nr:F0F1 ATP synthase subunit delta [Campylobacterota bacterium]
MEELIAKKYIKAIKNSSNTTSMSDIADIFSILALSFKDEKFTSIINNPNVSSNDKSGILLESVKSINSVVINNLIKLLVEKNRISVIPAIAEELRKDIANSTRNYTGYIYSDSDIDSKVVEDLSAGLSKKFNSTIVLDFVKTDFNGIKVDVEDLGIEIDFSKSRINTQMIEHIIKAI